MTISLAAALIQRSCNRQPLGDRLIPIQRAPGSPAGLQPGRVELPAQRDKVALVDDVLLGIEPGGLRLQRLHRTAQPRRPHWVALLLGGEAQLMEHIQGKVVEVVLAIAGQHLFVYVWAVPASPAIIQYIASPNAAYAGSGHHASGSSCARVHSAYRSKRARTASNCPAHSSTQDTVAGCLSTSAVRDEPGKARPKAGHYLAVVAHICPHMAQPQARQEVLMISAILVLTGTSSREEAQAIVDVAITQRLAAAAQVIGPVASTYRWEGALTHTDEWLCLLKTSTTLYETLEQTIRALHSYTLPSILAIPVVVGSTAYLTWLAQEVRQDKD